MGWGPSRTFDRYEIEAVLGTGGMGRVYRAFDPRLDRRVALKVLHAGDAGSQGTHAATRLIREARAAAALDHPNVVAIFDVGEVNGEPFIAMEFVPGRPLRMFIGDASISLAQKLGWLADIARALGAAHARGLVHRDIKPSNIIVREDGVLKVVDFGIARRTRLLRADPDPAPTSAPRPMLHGDDRTLTEQGTLVGTPEYMAPEQIRGEAIDGRTDQFAWAVVAYQLLTGRSPWGNKRREAAMEAILFGAAAPFERNDGVPPAIQAVIQRALSKDPGHRFPTMGELLAAFAPDATARRISVHPHRLPAESETRTERSFSQPAGPPTPSQRWSRAAVLIAVASAALGALALSPRRAPLVSRAQAGPADEPTAVSVSDLPVPHTANEAARNAYKDGMNAYRDGVFGADRRAFARAIALDPAFAAAELRYSLGISADEPSAEALEHFQRAFELRADLSEHDRVLLEAAEPYFRHKPADIATFEARLRAARDRYPKDADFALWLARVRFLRSPDSATNDFAQTIALDPKFGTAYSYAVEDRLYSGDFASAFDVLDTCLREAPSATICLSYRMVVDAQEGRCGRMITDAERAIGIEPNAETAYRWLAAGVYGETHKVDAARLALEQSWARALESSRPRTQARDLYSLAVLKGDFGEAERQARRLEALVAGDPSRMPHALPASELALLYREMGRAADAARAAQDFLERKEGWVGESRADDYTLARDPTPLLLAALRAGGPASDDAFRAARDAWAKGFRDRMLPKFAPFLWIHAYAATAEDRKDADDALAALPDYLPAPRFLPRTLAEADIGRVQFMAGRLDEALPLLERAATSCLALDFPIQHTRAQFVLGQAREQKGDVVRACAAYKTVTDRWGNTPSVTAESAHKRLIALRCAP